MESSPPPWEQVQAAFTQIWGYPQFRPPQDTIVRALLEQRDALVVLPTGGGKSLCFQLPALMQRGLTLVVSPLVALMEDQVQDLRQRGLPAAALHSEQRDRDRDAILRGIEQHRFRLLYVSPEGLLSPSLWERLQNPQLAINGLILDEAHCLVQWGDSFRPTYRRLGAVRPALLARRPAGTRLPIAAFTATADPAAQTILNQVLGLTNPLRVRLSPYRPQLELAIKTVWSPALRQRALGQFIAAHPGQSGLVYVRTRRDSETLAQTLQRQGYQVAPYHAGLPGPLRRQREGEWLGGELQFVVATNAFGMGVNKPDVRWVAHFHAPTLLAEYVQEVGRAGRDGQRSRALTLVSEPTGWLDPSDRQRSQFFAQQQQKIHQRAIALARTLPPQGTITQVQQLATDAPLALAYLHSQGRLTWVDPFTYQLHPRPQSPPLPSGTTDILSLLYGKTCRWATILTQFGCGAQVRRLGGGSGRCGHCDRCRA